MAHRLAGPEEDVEIEGHLEPRSRPKRVRPKRVVVVDPRTESGGRDKDPGSDEHRPGEQQGPPYGRPRHAGDSIGRCCGRPDSSRWRGTLDGCAGSRSSHSLLLRSAQERQLTPPRRQVRRSASRTGRTARIRTRASPGHSAAIRRVGRCRGGQRRVGDFLPAPRSRSPRFRRVPCARRSTAVHRWRGWSEPSGESESGRRSRAPMDAKSTVGRNSRLGSCRPAASRASGLSSARRR